MLNSNGNSDFDRFCFNSKNANSVVCPKRKKSLVSPTRQNT